MPVVVRILGPLDVEVDGASVPVRGAKRRGMLALLAARATTPTSLDSLCDAIWPDQPNEAARRSAQTYISQFRRLMAVDTFPAGYQLDARGVSVDAYRFERLAADVVEGDVDATSRQLEEALSLWRGPALVEFADQEWARPLAARWEELRRHAEDRWFAVQRAAGFGEEIIPRLEAACAAEPLRETRWAQLIGALTDAGRPAEALRAYGRIRITLRDELGVSPSPALQNLQLAVLRHEPGPSHTSGTDGGWTRASPQTRPGGGESMGTLPAMLELMADPSTFVGRSPERETLGGLWRLARAGHSLLALVTGEAGIGKSRLVAELAAEVHGNGGRVLLGCCYEDVDQPYGPFTQALATDAAELSEAELRRRVDGRGEVLIRLAPELSRGLAHGRAGHADDAADVSVRGGMPAAIVDWLVASASTTPLLLVVEDIHWSSPSTRDLFRQFVRIAGREPLLVVATARDSPPDLDSGLKELLADLERSPAVTCVALTGLDLGDLAELAEVSQADAASILAETGGNPLLVTHLTADGRSGSLEALLARRDAILDSDTRGLLDLAATMGAEFDAQLLAAGGAHSVLDVLDALEKAIAAGLVVAFPGGPGRYGFVHALFRSHRYGALSARRRLELHAKAAAALATRSNEPGVVAERARHACLAVPIGSASVAVELSLEAAHEAELAYGFEEAAVHYRRALLAARSLHPPHGGATVVDLTVRLAAVLHRLGDPRGLPMLLGAAQQAREAGHDGALVKAAMSFSQFLGERVGADSRSLVAPVVEAALAVLGDKPSAARAWLLIELANTISMARVDEQIELATRAEAIARQVDDPDALAHVLFSARHMVSHPSRLEEYERMGAELEHVGQRIPSLAVRLAGVSNGASASFQRGAVEKWQREIDRFDRMVGDHDLPFFQLDVVQFGAQRAFLAGDLERADIAALEMAPLARTTGRDPALWTGSIRLLIRRLQARDGELRAGFERRVAAGEDSLLYECLLAAVAARTESTREALHLLARVRESGFAIPEGYTWSLAMTELAEAAEVAGDPDTAHHVLAACGAYSGRIASAGICPNRPFDQALSQAALAAHDNVLAECYAARAVDASRERNTPVYLCRELVFLAEARRRTGAPDAALRPLIEEATAIAEPIGARAVFDDLERFDLHRE